MHKILIAAALAAFSVGTANAALLELTLSGNVDGSGASVGGVSAPIGSAFTVNMIIDDANAAVGSYAINSMSYTTTVGTYDTISSWVNPLTVAGSDAAMTMDAPFETNASTEHMLFDLTNFGVGSLFNDALSWNGVAVTGDIIIRGIGGFGSLDQLSGIQPFAGTLSVSTAVPVPAAVWLFGSGLGLLGWIRRRKTA
jgi:hypothetical protein